MEKCSAKLLNDAHREKQFDETILAASGLLYVYTVLHIPLSMLTFCNNFTLKCELVFDLKQNCKTVLKVFFK